MCDPLQNSSNVFDHRFEFYFPQCTSYTSVSQNGPQEKVWVQSKALTISLTLDERQEAGRLLDHTEVYVMTSNISLLTVSFTWQSLL